MSTRDPLIGQVVADRYEVLGVLSRTANGAVYMLKHRKLDRKFVLKRLAAELSENPEAIARFRREANVMSSLHHPNIVEILDWEVLPDGSPCMVFEFLSGEDLASRLERLGTQSWDFILRVADQVLAALTVAHRAAVVHRDLKPQNVFMERNDLGEENAKLLDFGLSKVQSSKSLLTGNEQIMGTPAYMAPEQADGRPDLVGRSTDVWGMGTILYELATGVQPFTAPSMLMVLERICNGTPEPIAKQRADAPPAFIALVERMLTKDPAARPSDVSEIRGELREALKPVAPDAFSRTLIAPHMPEMVKFDAPATTVEETKPVEPRPDQTPVSGSVTIPREEPRQFEPRQKRPSAIPIYVGVGGIVFALAIIGWMLMNRNETVAAKPAPVAPPPVVSAPPPPRAPTMVTSPVVDDLVPPAAADPGLPELVDRPRTSKGKSVRKKPVASVAPKEAQPPQQSPEVPAVAPVKAPEQKSQFYLDP